MEETNYWEQFKNTGNIGDYLNYKQKEQDMGVHPYAGNSERNRNDIEDGAYRGI